MCSRCIRNIGCIIDHGEGKLIYAIVAPGYSLVTTDWSKVERVKALYPYPKWKKCVTEEEAQLFVRRNYVPRPVKLLYNYGDTFSDLYVTASYRIGKDCLYFEFDTQRVGRLRIPDQSVIVEYKGSMVYVKMPDIYLSETSLSSHMSAIYNLLNTLGPNVDVNIKVKYFAVYYAITSYSGTKVRTINVVKDFINSRLCKVAFTLEEVEQ